MACGLSELETAANPYISVLGDPTTGLVAHVKSIVHSQTK